MGQCSAEFVVGVNRYPLAESGVNYVRALGMSPGVTTFALVGTPSPAIAIGAVGSLVLKHDAEVVTIVGETVHATEKQESVSGGLSMIITTKDGRWRNQYGYISGWYNQPEPGQKLVDGTPDPATGTLNEDTTISALVTLLAGRIGITIDKSRLDADATLTSYYPPIRWEWANPAQELERLLAEVGYGVAYLLNGTYRVVRLGDDEGVVFAAPFEEYANPRIVANQKGEYAVVVGARVVVQEQTDALEACGEDVDGQIQPLNGLLYSPAGQAKPYGGFEYCANDELSSDADDGIFQKTQLTIPPNHTAEEVERLASQCVWKWYRIPEQHHFRLPWLDRVCDTINDAGRIERARPTVYAKCFDEEAGANQADAVVVPRDQYTINLASGIVQFADQKYLLDEATNERRPALVYAVIAYESVGDGPGNPTRPTVEECDYYFYPGWTSEKFQDREAPDFGTQYPEIIDRPDLRLYVKWDSTHTTATPLNLSELNAFAAKLLASRVAEAPTYSGGDGLVPRLVAFNCNGGFRQVRWSVTQGGGASTQVTLNGERATGRQGWMPYRERLWLNDVGVAARKGKRGEKSGGTARNVSASPLSAFSLVPPAERESSKSRAALPIVRAAQLPASIPYKVDRGALLEIEAASAPGRRLLRVRRPTSATTPATIAVVHEPLPAEGAGRVCVSGMAWARIKSGEEENVVVGGSLGWEADSFDGVPGGPLPVVAKDGSFALVRIGAGGGSVVPIRIVSASGSAPPFTYTAQEVSSGALIGVAKPAKNDAESHIPAEIAEALSPLPVGMEAPAWFDAAEGEWKLNVPWTVDTMECGCDPP